MTTMMTMTTMAMMMATTTWLSRFLLFTKTNSYINRSPPCGGLWVSQVQKVGEGSDRVRDAASEVIVIQLSARLSGKKIKKYVEHDNMKEHTNAGIDK